MPWPVDETYIVECEQAMGLTLPDTYRNAMRAENGGAVICDGDTWDLHPIWDKSDKKRLKRTCNDVARETRAMTGWRGWPKTAVCIAANGTGDALMFASTAGACGPAVYHWCHETGRHWQVAHDFANLQRA